MGNVNRLIAMGGTNNPSAVSRYYKGQNNLQRQQMNNLAMQRGQQTDAEHATG